MATDYDINYNDKRFTQVEADKNAALSELEQTYGGMINNSDKYYQAQIDASKEWADKQTQLQQENTDFAIEQIEQQKAQTKQDYIKEQSGAYADWQKQSGQYGANAEQMAANGLRNTGYSESSQVSMYNTYQNRVAAARQTYDRAIQNYNNSITEARLQNNSVLAEIAYEALQQQLELSLQGFQYKNNLILEQSGKKLEVEQMYHQRYQDVLDQMNTENALAEQVRQYDKNYALQQKEYEESVRRFNEELRLAQREQTLAEQKWNFEKKQALGDSSGGGSAEITKSGSSETSSAKITTPKSDAKAVNKDDTTSGGKSSEPTIDTKSLNKVGLAGASGEKIAEMEGRGIIESYEENGKIKFRYSKNNLESGLFSSARLSGK